MIDSDISWKYHIDFIHHKISGLIGIVAKIKDVYYMAACLRDWKQGQSKRFESLFHLPFVGQVQVSSLLKTLLIQDTIDPCPQNSL